MATEISLTTIPVAAGADHSANQYRFVTINSSGQAVLSGNGASADGVLQDKPSAAGRIGAVGILGVSKVVAGAAITRGADVASDANGKAKTAATGNRVLGKALEAAAADGDWITVLLKVSGAPNA